MQDAKLIKAILFDLDGTLVDTAGDLVGAVNTLLVQNNKPPLPYEQLRPWVSQGGLVLVSIAFNISSESDEAHSLWKQFIVEYKSRISRCSSLFPGMMSLLSEIENSELKWGIVTNKPNLLTNSLLNDLGLTVRASCIVCGDTLERSKPWPDPVLYACKKINIDPYNAILFGDDKRDIDAGRAAGVTSIAAAWGYIRPEDDITKWNADGIVYHPNEISFWL